MNQRQGYDLLEVIKAIDPATADYSEWVAVGMALKEAGHSVSDWDDWSAGDAARYHAGECKMKWNGFTNNRNGNVTGGTIVQMARDRGWAPTQAVKYDDALSWDSEIGEGVVRFVDPHWIEDDEISEPSSTRWHPAQDLIKYLEALFEPDEKVGYVTGSWKKKNEDRYMPKKGSFDRTAGKLIQELAGCGDDIGSVLGDYNKEAGAWIRFNPLDGRGVKNDNVTDYRYALVESDNLPPGRQSALIRELELPVAAMVYSGKKSVHAIVKIEAGGYEEYRRRVDYLYHICAKNGLIIDQQNRNPSRLSRMPGATRSGHKQFLIGTNIGKTSWEEWREWIEAVNDGLPDFEGLDDVWGDMPDLAPSLIEGVLRQGHKMLLAGPSKAGKSFMLIELVIAIAEGLPWLGWPCAQGKVLYINLELDRASCLHRFMDVYDSMGLSEAHAGNIDIWNLRGKSLPMDKLAPKLIRRAEKNDYIAVVIDPIYKIITGDENSADQMAAFCNQFDKVCTELGCSVIYCHHHSKGSQAGKRSMDRASGSGVFARDPDALVDMTELLLDQDLRLTAKLALDLSDEKEIERLTAWRVDCTLREFPKQGERDIFFNWPVHMLDERKVLEDASYPGEFWKDRRDGNKKERRAEKRKDEIEMAYEQLRDFTAEGLVQIEDMARYLDKSERTVRRYINESEKFAIKSNAVISIKE